SRHEIRPELSCDCDSCGGIGRRAGINPPGRARTGERTIGRSIGGTRKRYPLRRSPPDLPARQPTKIGGTSLCRLAYGATRRRRRSFLRLKLLCSRLTIGKETDRPLCATIYRFHASARI